MQPRSSYIAFGTPDFTDAEIEAVSRVMRSGWVGMGPEVLAFENELADYVGAPHVVSVNSCTSALFLALLAHGIGPGDEVIVPSLTWCATANAALYLGARPVLCDVDPQSMCITPDTVLAKISSRTRAVIAVHYGGYAIDVDLLRRALPQRVAIIEDAAHALGSVYDNGKRVGSSGNIVCFSFYANKNVSTADGGAIALFDSEKAEHLRCLRMSGLESNAWSRYTKPSTISVAGIVELGYKMNFTDLQAAIGRVQLSRLDEMSLKRRSVATRYQELLHDRFPFQSGVFDEGHARHLLVARFDPAITGISRNDLLRNLRSRNVGASLHYTPLHQQPLYCQPDFTPLPVTDFLAAQIMTLPINAKMKLEDVDYVAEQLMLLLENPKRSTLTSADSIVG